MAENSNMSSLTSHTDENPCARAPAENADCPIYHLAGVPLGLVQNSNMSSLTSHNRCAHAPAENADWRRQLDEAQKILASKAPTLLQSLRPGNLQSVEDAKEMLPVIFSKLEELEKLQQSRLDDIHRYHDEWQQNVSEQQNELTGLRQKTRQQEENANKVGRELGALANQRVNALEKLNAIKEASAKHEESFRQEQIRLDERSAALDHRERELQSQSADLIRANEALNQTHRHLADKQEEERKREEENKKKTARIHRRLDYLVTSQVQWEQQIAQLEDNIQGQKKELSKLHALEVEKANLGTSLVHLTSVTLPQKEAELNGFKAELAETKDNTRASENELKNRISKLDAEISTLQDQCREQSTHIKELEEDHEYLQIAVKESSDKAQSADEKLAIAEATVGSLNLELDYLQKEEARLKLEVSNLKLCKIDFDAAKRIQDASNAKIRELEQESHKLCLNHSEVRQQLEKLQDRHTQLKDEVRKSMVLHDDAMKMEKNKLDAAHRRCHAAEQSRNEAIEESITAKADRDHLAADNHGMMLRRNELQDQVDTLSAERDNLSTVNALIQQEKVDLSRILNETEDEVQRLTQQLQSCDCFNKRSSRKRRHEQVDSDEEELSSADEPDRLAPRSGKAPESRANLRAMGHSDALRNSVSSELPESSIQTTSGPTTRSAVPVMNTTATRALGTANPTITPSDRVAFTFSVQDATLLNFSSDVLPTNVVQALVTKFRGWSAKTTFKWSIRQFTTSRSCIEARLERKKSEWKDGPDYACDLCDRRMRLCVVVNGREQILLLPRKAAETVGEGPADDAYWMR